MPMIAVLRSMWRLISMRAMISSGRIAAYLEKLGALGPDGVIVADPGVFMTAHELMPQIPLHLSTQANSTNYKTVEFWQRLGIHRINLARELTLAEIKDIGEQAQIEIEAFVQGAMCIAYSGRLPALQFYGQPPQQPRHVHPSLPLEIRAGGRNPSRRIYAHRRRRPGDLYFQL